MTTNLSPQLSPAALQALLAGSPRRSWVLAGVVTAAIAVLAATALVWLHSGPAGPQYATEPARRADVALSVVANGTLAPTRTVSIGSELSGTVARVLVDVNDPVRKGQVLVELDTAKLRDQVARSTATLATARATLATAEATVKEARANLGRLREMARLSGGRMPAQADLDTAEATLDRALASESGARAAIADARAALSTDTTNVEKAAIRSPIDGVILTRSVDPGNAVAASLQAVTLFTIGEDLRRLQLQVNVDEADVSTVKPGQQAEFTVSAWLDRKFAATITRVAYGSSTTDNVVTYQTKLDVANPDLALRPGMTATATVRTVQRRDVLVVPNSALRFTPSAGVPQERQAPGGGLVSRLMPHPPDADTRGRTAAPPPAAAKQVYVLRDGRAVAVPVTLGISDGRVTEVTGGELAEGAPVITEQRSAPKS